MSCFLKNQTTHETEYERHLIRLEFDNGNKKRNYSAKSINSLSFQRRLESFYHK